MHAESRSHGAHSERGAADLSSREMRNWGDAVGGLLFYSLISLALLVGHSREKRDGGKREAGERVGGTSWQTSPSEVYSLLLN